MVLYVPNVQSTNATFSALVVGVHDAEVAFFAGNRRLVMVARGVHQEDVLVVAVLPF